MYRVMMVANEVRKLLVGGIDMDDARAVCEALHWVADFDGDGIWNLEIEVAVPVK